MAIPKSLHCFEKESSFNSKAGSTYKGLGQLYPNTAKEICRIKGWEYRPDLLYNPEYNIKLSIALLGHLNKKYNGDIHMVLTAYNRGEGGAEKYRRTYNTSRSSYSKDVIRRSKKYKYFD